MNLSIAEKFLMLAKHPTKGSFLISDIHLGFGLVGAILRQMSIEKIFEMENNRLVLREDVEEGKFRNNPIVTEIYTKIRDSSRSRKMQYWISRIHRKSNIYKWMILSNLEEKGLIRIEPKKFLFIFTYRRCYMVDNISREKLIDQLRNNALDRRDLNEENVVLLRLVEACKMHKILTSDKSEVKLVRTELKSIMKDSPIANEVDKTIKGVQTAIVTSIAVSAAVASSGR